MSDDMNIVIVGERAVHDGLGNKLEGTKRVKGHVVSQPVHTVPGTIGKILCDMDLAEVSADQSAPAPEEPQEPAAEPDSVEVGIAEAEAETTPTPDPVTEPEPDSVEEGIKEGEAESAPQASE